jgi:predicted dehydrogenase
VYYAAAEYIHDYSEIGGVGDWRFDPAIGRHVFLGGGCHAVDLMRWFLDDLDTVSAQGSHFAVPHLPRGDTLLACYKTVSGRIGRTLVAGGAKRPYGVHLEIYGTEGTAVASNVEAEARVWLKRLEGPADRWIALPAQVSSHPVADQMRQFLACLRGECEPLVSGLEGAKTVAAALGGIRAAESGRVESAALD